MALDQKLKTVVITGANRGLGLGFVSYYLQKGWSVLASCRDLEKSIELKSLSHTYPESLQIELLDVSNENAINNFSNLLKTHHLKFDMVINNAGIHIEENFGNWTSKTFEATFKVNTIGVALFSQTVMPFIKPKGKLINMSSGMGSMALNINPDTGSDAYAMSKAALNILTARLAVKLQSKSICAIALSPGWVQTDMGGPDAPLTVNSAIGKLVNTINKLTISDTGKFFSEDGEELPW